MGDAAPGGLLAGKRALILGVANDHSIAWGIAKAFAAHGAELAFTYQGEGFGRRVVPLAESLGAQLEAVFADWRERYARLFREAQAVGELRADLDPQQVAEFYLNSFEGAVLRAKVSKSPAPLRLFMTLMFDGVLQGNTAAR